MSKEITRYLESRALGHPHAGKPLTPKGYDRVRRILTQVEKLIDSSLTSITAEEARVVSKKIATYNETTQMLMRSTLRQFYEWATYEKLYDQPNYFWFMDRNDAYPMEESIPAMPMKKIRALMKEAGNLPNEQHALGLQLMIGLTGLAGLRFGEVGEVEKADIQNDGIIVRRDGRFVPLDNQVMELLRQAASNSSTRWAIQPWDHASDPTKPIADFTVTKYIERFMQSQSKIDIDGFMPGSLRRGFVTQVQKKIKDQDEVYSLIGHAHIKEQPLRPIFTHEELVKAYKKVVSE